MFLRRRSRITLQAGKLLPFPLPFRRRSASRLAGPGRRAAPSSPLLGRSLGPAFPSWDARSPGSGQCSRWSVAGHESPLTPGHGTFLALNHPCTSGISGRRFPSRLSILHPCQVGHAASPFVSQLVTGRSVTPPRTSMIAGQVTATEGHVLPFSLHLHPRQSSSSLLPGRPSPGDPGPPSGS